MNEKLQQLSEALIQGKHLLTEEITQELIGDGMDPKTVIDLGLMTGMQVVGKNFKDGVIFLPQVLVSARAMKTSMVVLEPLLVRSSYRAKGKILLGTVKGDVHDIGKNLVAIMLRGAGYDVVDIGVGRSAEEFIQTCEQYKPDIIGLSALLTTTMLYMKVVIDSLSARDIRVPVIVGGAPVTHRFAGEIGAAGYARNAAEAVELVKSILKKVGVEHERG
ncbi:MAG: corrinoid protein [Ignavibacteriales bacterium]|nr:corrinoid protein [Ignavibacteriales bacterium]